MPQPVIPRGKSGDFRELPGEIVAVVEANIEGRWFDDLIVVPASALLKDNRVAIIDRDNRLRFRTVEVLRREREQAIVKAGLDAGEQVFVSGLHHPVEGIAVTPIEIVP